MQREITLGVVIRIGDHDQVREPSGRQAIGARQQLRQREIAVHIRIADHETVARQQRQRAGHAAAGLQRRPTFVGVAERR